MRPTRPAGEGSGIARDGDGPDGGPHPCERTFSMQFPSRSARVALLAGVATLGLAGTADAAATIQRDGNGELTVTFENADNVVLDAVNGDVELNGADTDIRVAGITTLEVLEVGGAGGANTIDLSAVAE